MKMIAFVAMMWCVGAAVFVEKKLLASDAIAGDEFGYAVAISGKYLIVGAPYNDDNDTDTGSAYIFENKDGSWVQVAHLHASDAATLDRFGYSVGMSGNVAVVGAFYNDDNGSRSGTAYIFENQNGSWVQVAHLFASDADANDFFGFSVGVSGTVAIVGAYQNDDNGTNSGTAYIYEKQGMKWVQTALLYANDGADIDLFGYSVGVSGNIAIVGARLNDDNGSDSGSAYIFEKQGGSWVQVAQLYAIDAADNDEFGYSTAVSGNTIIVGAPFDSFGGSNPGSAYIFEKQGVNWVQTAGLRASDPAAGDYFGRSVGVSGNVAIVGAYGNDDNGSASGSAYVFEKQGVNWVQTAQLYASDADGLRFFGYSVGMSGINAVVGMHRDDDNGSLSGSAFIFTRCVANQVVAQDQCVDCGAGEVPNGSQSACVACGAGEVTNGDQSACVACGAGEVPNGDKTACVAASTTTSSGGTDNSGSTDSAASQLAVGLF